jgi:hypothetical protein
VAPGLLSGTETEVIPSAVLGQKDTGPAKESGSSPAFIGFADGSAAGIRGIPSFVLGVPHPDDPNNLTAMELLRGAQPFEAFQTVIDKLLAEGRNAAGIHATE